MAIIEPEYKIIKQNSLDFHLRLEIAGADLVIENGWYHEVERVFHFTNNDHEYVFDASEYRLHIYRTDSKTGKTEEIANYHIDEVYSQIPGAF